MRDIHFEESFMCFYGICRISTFDSSLTVPVITVFTASIKSAQHLLPSEILTAIIECEWHKTVPVFCDHDQKVAFASHSMKPLDCGGRKKNRNLRMCLRRWKKNIRRRWGVASWSPVSLRCLLSWRGACPSEEHSLVVTANDCWGFSMRSCLKAFAQMLISDDGNEDDGTRCKSLPSRTRDMCEEAWHGAPRSTPSCTPAILRWLTLCVFSNWFMWGNMRRPCSENQLLCLRVSLCHAVKWNLEALHQFYCDSTIMKFQLPLLCGLLSCHLAQGPAL